MSTPIYDDLCETMPAPSGIDEEEAVPGQGNEGNGAAARNGRPERKATAHATDE